MSKDRQDYEDHQDTVMARRGAAVLEAETLRPKKGEDSQAEKPAKSEEKISLFWRVFGGTILSIVALVCVTVYNNFSETLDELRRDIKAHTEAKVDLVKKEDFSARMSSVWGGIKDLQHTTGTIQALGERAKHLDLQVERQIKSAEDERKDLQRKLDDLRKGGEDDRKEFARKADDLRKELENDRTERGRKMEEQRRTFEEERKEMQRRFEDQVKVLEEERRTLQAKVQTLAERLATVEGRQNIKTPPKAAAAPTGN